MKVDVITKMNDKYNYSQHIVTKYMPYAEKCAFAKAVVDSSSYKEVNGVKVYVRNTNAMLFVFTVKVLEAYTDIELDPEKITEEYDKLMQTGKMNALMSCIPNEEITILRGMIDNELEDIEVNTRSLVSFLESKADAIQLAIDGLINVLSSPEMQARITSEN